MRRAADLRDSSLRFGSSGSAIGAGGSTGGGGGALGAPPKIPPMIKILYKLEVEPPRVLVPGTKIARPLERAFSLFLKASGS